MESKYRRFFSRLMPDTSGPFRDYSRKWLILGVPLGLLTGVLTIILDEVVRDLFLGGTGGQGGSSGLSVAAFNYSPVLAFALPFTGIFLTVLLLRRFASRPLVSGSDEVIEHYHQDEGPMEVKEGAVKYVGAILTIGLGGLRVWKGRASTLEVSLAHGSGESLGEGLDLSEKT